MTVQVNKSDRESAGLSNLITSNLPQRIHYVGLCTSVCAPFPSFFLHSRGLAIWQGGQMQAARSIGRLSLKIKKTDYKKIPST